MRRLIVYNSGNFLPLFYPRNSPDGHTSIRVEQQVPRDTTIIINGAQDHHFQDLIFAPDECPRMGVKVRDVCWQYGSESYDRLRMAAGLQLDCFADADELQTDSNFFMNHLDALKDEDDRIQLYNAEISLNEISLYFWHTEHKSTFAIVISNVFDSGVDLYVPTGFYDGVPCYRVIVETYQAVSMIGKEPHKHMLRLMRFFRTVQKDNQSLTERDPEFTVRMSTCPHNADMVMVEYESSNFEITSTNLERVIHNYNTGVVLFPL